MGKSTANRAAHRLRLKGWLRFDNQAARLNTRAPSCSASPKRTLGHSTTPSRASQSLSSGNATGEGECPTPRYPVEAGRLVGEGRQERCWTRWSVTEGR